MSSREFHLALAIFGAVMIAGLIRAIDLRREQQLPTGRFALLLAINVLNYVNQLLALAQGRR